MSSLTGQLLIAPPQLKDPNFERSIVLLLQHDPQGALGLILNRPVRQTVADLWAMVRESTCRVHGPVHQGGPVQGPLTVLHQDPILGDEAVLPGVFHTSDAESIERLITTGADPIRCYAGYAGWGAGQLEVELQTASWLTLEAQPAHVFHAGPEDLWGQLYPRAIDDRPYPTLEPPPRDDPDLN